ncbi:MAG: hypothetical protein JSS66_12995 [Armatimonadetes bacterium]|nr:hypothetical protein [Armatimonadota bacterium]
MQYTNWGRTALWLGSSSLAVSILVIASKPAYPQLGGQQPSYVKLQSSSPGAVQTGNSNISGVGLFGTALRIGTSSGVNGTSFLDVRTPTGAGLLGGMFVNTQSATGLPFYGYAANGVSKGLTYVDGSSGNWNVSLGGSDRLTVTPSGNVGIGINSPFSALTVAGNEFIIGNSSGAGNAALIVQNGTTDSQAYGIKGRMDSNGFSVAGVYGQHAGTGAGYGAFGESLTAVDGIGVFGKHSASTGVGSGVEGWTNSTAAGGLYPGASGVLGLVNTTTPGVNSAGVRGVNSGMGSDGMGVIGVHSGNGIGVYGRASGSAGGGQGGNFSAFGPNSSGVFGDGGGQGVFGRCDQPTGSGVFGWGVSTTGANYGGYFRSFSTSGTGAYGWASASSGTTVGLYGQSDSGTGYGVFGYASKTSGGTTGTYGLVESTSGVGVLGLAASSSGGTIGVEGVVNSFQGVAVAGLSTDTSNGGSFGGYFTAKGSAAQGIHSVATSTIGTNYGVVGESLSANGYGLYSLGRTGASGTKSFRIDHPSDPTNKYLLHYSAEGPEPQNIYNGTVKTDAKGVAWVELPDYYKDINKEPRYQLTVVDDNASPTFVQVKVARKIQGNRFMIMTSAPYIEVCWEVKAIRNDLWMRKNGAPVEVEKVGLEKGTYQQPELYNQPRERAWSYRPEASQRFQKPGAMTSGPAK